MKSKIDFATIGGLIIAVTMICATIILGGDAKNFLQLPSILLVVGGTFSLTTICFSLSDMAKSPKVIKDTILYSIADPSTVAIEIIKMSTLAREKGVLALEGELERLRKNPLFFKSMRLLVDGVPAQEIEAMLRNEFSAIRVRHEKSANILKKAGELAPGMGLIGTLIGLVQMLANLEDPSTIGPAMGLALLTTFYGAVLANMVFNPLAAKLENNASEEDVVNTLYLIGATSIAKQENPRRLEMQLNTVLPPAQRVRVFD